VTEDIDKKIVFCLGKTGNGATLVIMGIPEGAWDHMKDGKHHNFDFTRAGLPVQLLMYGAKTHAEAMTMLQRFTSAQGITIRDERRKDFSIKGDKT
jgi:hypothetical protein